MLSKSHSNLEPYKITSDKKLGIPFKRNLPGSPFIKAFHSPLRKRGKSGGIYNEIKSGLSWSIKSTQKRLCI